MVIRSIDRNSLESTRQLLNTLENIVISSEEINLYLNVKKSKLMIIPKKNCLINLDLDLLPQVQIVDSLKLLGVTFSSNLKWDQHINITLKKCNSRLYALRVLRPIVSLRTLENTCKSIILPLLDYASSVFVCLPFHLQNRLQHFYKRCHRIIHERECNCDVFEDINNRRMRLACKLYKSAESMTSHPLHELIPRRYERSGQYYVEISKTSRRQRQFQLFVSMYLNSIHLE